MTEFSNRYAVAVLSDGGIAVDLKTGGYVRLNRSAALICAALARCETLAEATALVARDLNVPEDRARSKIVDIMQGLSGPVPRREPVGAFRYRPADEGVGYVLSYGGMPRLLVNETGASVRLPDTARRATASQVFEYLRTVAPKLLYLRGATVLHGSACWTGNNLRGFCGESGAGKTTTARAFAGAGHRLFAEDMLVLASISPLRFHTAGEETIRAWAAEGSVRLTEGTPGREYSTDRLMTTLSGPPALVGEVWFIDAARRSHETDTIELRRLTPTDGALAIMSSLFLGTILASGWRRFLEMAAALGSTLPLFEAVMPAGLHRLEAAASRYTENSAS